MLFFCIFIILWVLWCFWKMGLVITLIRLSPAPNHHNLSYLLIKSFFNTQCNLTLSPVHVWGLQGLSASFWGQTRGVGAPALWYQLLQKWALSASCWSRWGSWLPLTGVGTASVPKNSYWEEPAWWSKRGTQCRQLEQAMCLVLGECGGQLSVSSPNRVCTITAGLASR